jgi:hypothetical protein
VQHRRHDGPACLFEPLDRVHCAEDLGERRTRTVEIDAEVVAGPDETVPAASEPVAVDLKSMPQSRLHDPVATLDLVDQSMHVRVQLVVDPMDVAGDDGAEQQSTESRRRVDREDEVTERKATCWHSRAGVPQLELGEQHASRVVSEVVSDAG